MLIAGDGHTNIFGPDVSSLDPKTWYETGSGQALMHGLRQAKLTATPIPENETLKDDDKAWEYFDQLRFDVILANPPFAGEMKDRKMLAHYELAKPALKRAEDDKQPKEERDVLFIERILKMLKPGGRAAIVLPQGKFNNSSLAFIREWILKKARLLAVVGLHPNTFKPHTGTKTSVLFVQKYTQQQLAGIAKVHDEVATACPDYEADIQQLLASHADALPEGLVPEAIADLLAETFSEPEVEDIAETNGDDETADDQQPSSDEDRIAQAEEKLDALKAEQKRLEKLVPQAERELKLLTLRGKLELVLADADLIGTLKERWIAAEVAKRLDYPIFMAVSERGGKDNSGDYVYMIDANGNRVEDHDGQPKIDQDLVNYDLTAEIWPMPLEFPMNSFV